jgi:4-hydroxybenzoate polyprenyltransferase
VLKSTWFSWLPYAVAFGTLPAVASLAGPGPAWPPWWMTAAGAALGVGAHVVNALPDLADDARTGVRGMPHRLGEPTARPLAAALLVAASLLAALGPAGHPAVWVWGALALVVALAAALGSVSPTAATVPRSARRCSPCSSRAKGSGPGASPRWGGGGTPG